MKSELAVAALLVASSACSYTHAFQSHAHAHQHPHSTRRVGSMTSTLLDAKKKKPTGGGQGFGASPSPKKEPKYFIEDKSYGTSSPSISTEQTFEEAQASMIKFFATYSDWKPLMKKIMCQQSSSSPLAAPLLSDIPQPDQLFGISTLEQRNPWKLLPPKPESDSSLEVISTFLDEWQQSLLDIPLDALITGDNDMHFLEEGRRTIAVTRFHVLEKNNNNNNAHKEEEEEVYDWEMELFRTCWSEMAHLMSQDENDTGSMVLLPDHLLGDEGERGLDYVQGFVENNLIRPIQWLGRQEDLEITAMERGSLGVRLLYKLSEIPDLGERDSGSDESVSF